MSEQDTQNTAPKRRRSDQVSLESWKAIANYLNKSVRTVRRWEADEALPVHRHRHSKGFSVYALRAELDEWKSRKFKAAKPEPKDHTSAEGHSKLRKLLQYAAIVVIAAGAGYWIKAPSYQQKTADETASYADASRVLIAHPTASRDVAHIGDSLSAALHREISETPSFDILPESAVQLNLRLMRHDPQMALTPQIAKEVAIRDGRTPVLLVPHVEQIGASYVLSVEIVDPVSDRLIAYPSQNVDNVNSIYTAIDLLAQAVGVFLPNNFDAVDSERLPAVTTDSMQSLHLYAQAEFLLHKDEYLPAAELLRLALADDPDFAAAKTLNAWAMRNHGAELKEYLPIAKSATLHSNEVSLEERLFIEGSFHHFSANSLLARADFGALAEAQPNNQIAARALYELCAESEPGASCASAAIRLAEIRKDHFQSNLQAAMELISSTGDVNEAMRFANRALELLRSSDKEIGPAQASLALMFPAIAAWIDGDLVRAEHLRQNLRTELPNVAFETRRQLLREIADFAIALGQIDEARELMALMPDPRERYEVQASILFASGNLDGLKAHLSAENDFRGPQIALLMALSGQSEAAVRLADKQTAGAMSNGEVAVIRAMSDLSNDRVDSARRHLQSALASLGDGSQAYYLVALDLLSGISKTDGNLIDAISILETTMPRRADAALGRASIFWLMCQRRLASFYHEAGRELDAVRVEDQLRGLLKVSDEDFPLTRSLQGV